MLFSKFLMLSFFCNTITYTNVVEKAKMNLYLQLCKIIKLKDFLKYVEWSNQSIICVK